MYVRNSRIHFKEGKTLYLLYQNSENNVLSKITELH